MLVHSRYQDRLEQLAKDLDYPDRMVTFVGSLLGDDAEDTIENAMHLTGGQLNHVATTSAVRWWAPPGECDDAGYLSLPTGGALLETEPTDFIAQTTQLPLLQFNAARHLLPRLRGQADSSYTFVTGGIGEEARSPIGQINSHAVWGLAAALRSEARARRVPTRVGELRVGLRVNRSRAERLAHPREEPLSHSLGRVCAGIAASEGSHELSGRLLRADTATDVQELNAAFPVVDRPYSVYYHPDL